MTRQEKIKKQEEIIEGLREELSNHGTSLLQNELVDLEAMYANGTHRSHGDCIHHDLLLLCK